MRFHASYLAAAALFGILSCSNDDAGPNDDDDDGGGEIGAVTIGNTFFRSAHNGTTNPAIDTVPAGTTVTWTWTNTGSISHSVRSTDSPNFVSSAIEAGNGNTYGLAFDTPGTYEYDCAVHGSAMTGRLVVQ